MIVCYPKSFVDDGDYSKYADDFDDGDDESEENESEEEEDEEKNEHLLKRKRRRSFAEESQDTDENDSEADENDSEAYENDSEADENDSEADESEGAEEEKTAKEEINAIDVNKVREEELRAKAVASQYDLYDRLFESRIQMQKVVSKSHHIPQPDVYEQFVEEVWSI